MTANDLIASSLRLIGVLGSGETPGAAEAADALSILNDMLDSWDAERVSIFEVIRNGGSTDTNTFALVASQQGYTLGTGGDFNVARPPKIERASIEYLANPAQPIELPIDIYNEQRWQAIPVKSTTSNIPKLVYVRYSFPRINLAFWPVPNEVHNVMLYYWNRLTQFATLTTDNTYPPAYIKALRYNLAVDLAPEFGRSVPVEIAIQAQESKALLKRLNVDIPLLGLPRELVRRGQREYDWRSDEII